MRAFVGDPKVSGLRNWIIGMVMTFAETRKAVDELIVGESWPLKALLRT